MKQALVIQDRVYGDIRIHEPVIIDLLASKELQRLKGIDLAGYFEPYMPGRSQTRFEHSVGVYWLLKRFGATLEEQIAGLIHDVSHSVFSHCIDYILPEGSPAAHSHQDTIFPSYVRNSTIPSILETYGFSCKECVNHKNFPLLEQILPDICADRLDYSFRTAVAYERKLPSFVERFLGSIKIRNKQWVFSYYEIARDYAELFLHLNRTYYAGMKSAVMFYAVGQYMKHALSKKYINKQDLYTTDREVMDKINTHLSNDAALARFWDRMNRGVKVVNCNHAYEAHVTVKSRIVDPLLIDDGKVKRVSDCDPLWCTVVTREMVPKKYCLSFLSSLT